MASPGLSCAHLLALEERELLGKVAHGGLDAGVLWAALLHHLASQLLGHCPSPIIQGKPRVQGGMLGAGGVQVDGVVLLQLSLALLPQEEELASLVRRRLPAVTLNPSPPLPRRGLRRVADALPGENMVNLLAIVGPGSLVHMVVLDDHPRI